MKVAQILSTIPDALPKEYAPGTGAAAGQRAGHGLALRQAPHGRRTGPRLAERNSARSSKRRRARPRWARSIARPARRPPAGLQAAIPGHVLGGRGRPAAAEADHRRSTTATTARSRPARSMPRSGRAAARGAGLRARGQASWRSIAACSPDEAGVHVPDADRRSVDRPAADHGLARGPPMHERRRRAAAMCATPSRSTCSAPGTCRSTATA